MLVMVVLFIAFRWIHLSTPLIRFFLLVLILLLMPTLNFLPFSFALSLLRFRLPSRLPIFFILGIHPMLHSFPTRRSSDLGSAFRAHLARGRPGAALVSATAPATRDRKSTRLNSSHRCISYAVFCLKKKSSDYAADCL